MNAAIYSRVSTTGKGQDAENQSAQIRAWAKAQGHTIVAEYSDNVSGSGKAKRPAFERMMTDAAAKKFDAVFFWSLDRLSRQGVLETLQILQKLDQAGCCWRSHAEPYLDSCGAFKDAILAILAALAKQERLRISERVKAGLDRAASEGRKGGRRVIERDPKIIAKIHTLRDKGYSFNQIEEETGVPKSSVHRMMSG